MITRNGKMTSLKNSLNESGEVQEGNNAPLHATELTKDNDNLLMNAFSNLAKQQEDLGDEFEKVLFENIIELYSEY